MSQDFYQDLPELKKQFIDDELLVRFLQKKLSSEVFKSEQPELLQLGHLAGTSLNDLAQVAEARNLSFEISVIYAGMLLYLWSLQTKHQDDQLHWKIW